MSLNHTHARHDEPVRVFLLSQVRSEAAEAAGRSLERHFAGADLRTGGDVESLFRHVQGDGWFPDLVVVCQHWPGEFSTQDVRRLLDLLPLTRWMCVCGPWCESDGRNGSPWPQAVRVRAGCADLRMRRERAVLSGEATALPLTASRDEVFAFDHTSPPAAGGRNRRVDVVTADAEFRRTLRDLITAAGFVAEVRRSARPWVRESTAPTGPQTHRPTDLRGNRPAAVVWDADPYSDRCDAELRRFRAAQPSTVIVALMALPLPDIAERITAAGADVVLAKPVIASVLAAALKSALSR